MSGVPPGPSRPPDGRRSARAYGASSSPPRPGRPVRRDTEIRRTPRGGSAREEVALLAGISVEYYTRLERGNASGVSDDVLRRQTLFNSTTPSEPTCSISPAPRTPAPQVGSVAPQRSGYGPSSSRSSTRSPRPRRSATAAATTSPPTRSAAPCTRPYSKAANNHPTAPASPSSTRPRKSSSSTGSMPPETSSHTSAPRPDATRMTARSATWSASCPPAATPSANGGQPTTFATTRPEPNASDTPSSANSTSTTRSCQSLETACASLSSPPKSAADPRTASNCSPAGSQPPSSTKRRPTASLRLAIRTLPSCSRGQLGRHLGGSRRTARPASRSSTDVSRLADPVFRIFELGRGVGAELAGHHPREHAHRSVDPLDIGHNGHAFPGRVMADGQS